MTPNELRKESEKEVATIPGCVLRDLINHNHELIRDLDKALAEGWVHPEEVKASLERSNNRSFSAMMLMKKWLDIQTAFVMDTPFERERIRSLMLQLLNEFAQFLLNEKVISLDEYENYRQA